MKKPSNPRGRGCRRGVAASLLARAPVAAGAVFAAWAAPARAADPNEFIVWSEADLRGRMYVPDNYSPGGDHPFILFLHGFGERGTNNTSQVNSNIDPLLAEAKRRGAFLYAPQSAGGTWGTTAVTPTDDVQRSVNMMRAAQAAYPGIDDNRLYLTGLSAGGGGAWDALASFPRTFAAGAPICGTGGSALYRESLEDENIWTVHARNDPVVPVSNTRNMVNAIFTGDGFPAAAFPPPGSPNDASYAHGQLQYFEPALGGHGIWERVFRQPEFYDWMFAQELPAYLIADANADGRVDVADLGILATNFNEDPAAPGGRDGGDFNADGAVDVADLGILATYFNQPGPAAAAGPAAFADALASPQLAALAAPVPEPAGLALLALASVALPARRRRQIPAVR